MRKLFLYAVLLTLVIIPARFGYAGVDESLVLYLSFDEGEGNEAKDQSQYGNHAQVNDADWVEGKYGSAISVPASGQGCVTVPHSDSLVIEDEITMMSWININMHKGDHNQFIDKACHNGGEHNTYGMWTAGGRPGVRLGSDLGRQSFAATSDPIETGSWHHVAFTYGEDTGTFYVDGELVSEEERAFKFMGTNEFEINIGCPKDRGNYTFDGSIDEVAIYSRVLSEAEIKQVMVSGIAVSPGGKLATTWGGLKQD